jgi:hypothetical protein
MARSILREVRDRLLAAEQKRRSIAQDQTLERAGRLWSYTPAGSGEGFAAASMRINASKFEGTESRILALALAAVMGAVIGSLLVLIGSAVKKRRSGTRAS